MIRATPLRSIWARCALSAHSNHPSHTAPKPRDVAAILVIGRLCEPSSELHVAEQWYRTTALEDLLSVPAKSIYDERLYRTLDRLLPHKEAIEQHLVQRFGELFDLDYELLLYDVTSTYFEGQCASNRKNLSLGRSAGRNTTIERSFDSGQVQGLR